MQNPWASLLSEQTFFNVVVYRGYNLHLFVSPMLSTENCLLGRAFCYQFDRKADLLALEVYSLIDCWQQLQPV